jgi:hypothetical protein
MPFKITTRRFFTILRSWLAKDARDNSTKEKIWEALVSSMACYRIVVLLRTRAFPRLGETAVLDLGQSPGM